MRWLLRGNLIFIKWMDTKVVTVCRNFHRAYCGATVTRRLKRDNGQWSHDKVPVPDAINDYNAFMGGVDLSEALIQYYSAFNTLDTSTLEV